MATRAKAKAPVRTPAKIQKRKVGRPSKFQPEFCDQARKLSMLGTTNEDLAAFFEVGQTTIDRWIADIPEFRGALKAGRMVADAEVASRLFERACGYEHDDVDIRVVNGEIVQTRLRKYYPPDTAAAFIWLKNRRPEQWREKPHEGGPDDPPPASVPIQRVDASIPEPQGG